eukprot:gene9834-11490_t
MPAGTLLTFIPYQGDGCDGKEVDGVQFGFVLDYCSESPIYTSIFPSVYQMEQDGTPTTIALALCSDLSCSNQTDVFKFDMDQCNYKPSFLNNTSFMVSKNPPQYPKVSITFEYLAKQCQDLRGYSIISNGTTIDNTTYYCDESNNPYKFICDDFGNCQNHPISNQCNDNTDKLSVDIYC